MVPHLLILIVTAVFRWKIGGKKSLYSATLIFVLPQKMGYSYGV